jgi:hypothetical protein
MLEPSIGIARKTTMAGFYSCGSERMFNTFGLRHFS